MPRLKQIIYNISLSTYGPNSQSTLTFRHPEETNELIGGGTQQTDFDLFDFTISTLTQSQFSQPLASVGPSVTSRDIHVDGQASAHNLRYFGLQNVTLLLKLLVSWILKKKTNITRKITRSRL